MAQGNPRIAPTAHFTAQAWVRAGFDNADLFDTRTGRLIFGSLSRVIDLLGPMSPAALRYHREYLFIRHYAFEARLAELAPRFVLEIGAGLSPRGLTLARRNPELVYVEVDLPHMIAAKERCLAGVDRPANYHLTAVDLLGDRFTDELPELPSAGGAAVAITEGVSDYLSFDEKAIAYRNIARALGRAGGGRYLQEIHARELFRRHGRGAQLFIGTLGALVGRSFRDRLFDRVVDAHALLTDSGFDGAETLDADRLNPSSYRPPMDGCPWRLVEARISG
jgi:hypothetical protein